MKIDLSAYKGKRLASLDYGKKRIGYAYSDILHVTVSPKGVFNNEKGFLEKINEEFERNDVGLVVLGIPLRVDEKNTSLIEEIKELKEKIKVKLKLEVVLYDEAFSSQKAVERMISSGKKKKFRQEKSNIDSFAAAIILENFIKDYGDY